MNKIGLKRLLDVTLPLTQILQIAPHHFSRNSQLLHKSLRCYFLTSFLFRFPLSFAKFVFLGHYQKLLICLRNPSKFFGRVRVFFSKFVLM